MALGKPVFCYLREDLYQFNPIWKDCPIISVNPDTIEAGLEEFLRRQKEEHQQIGYKSRLYIEKYHSLKYIGDRFDTIIQKVLEQ